jgi:pimeloyl-ACP methyl ester carboxylesterase
VTAGVAATAVAGGLVTRTVLRRRHQDPEALEPLAQLPPERLERVRSLDGTELEVRAAGDPSAPILLFSHGFSLDMTAWHYQWSVLSERFRCVLYDQRSHGRSDRTEHLSVEALGQDLAAVIASVAADGPVVLVGHSMGGMAILALADVRPDLFGTAVSGALFSGSAAAHLLEGAMGSMTDLFRLRLGSLRTAAGRVNRVRKAVLASPTDIGSIIARISQFGPHASPHVVSHVVGLAASAPSEVWTELLTELMRMDLRDAAPLVCVPALIVVGDHDRVTPPAAAVTLCGLLPDARMELLEGAGHIAPLEQHERFNEILEAFAVEVVARSDGGRRKKGSKRAIREGTK